MNHEEFEQFLYDLLVNADINQVRTFEEAGVLTRNRGLVVQDEDGVDHQISILGSWR